MLTSTKQTIAFIGFGAMAGAIYDGARHYLREHRVLVMEKDTDRITDIQKMYPEI